MNVMSQWAKIDIAQPMRGSKTTGDDIVNIAKILRISLHAAKKKNKNHIKNMKRQCWFALLHIEHITMLILKPCIVQWCNDVLKLTWTNPNICPTSDKYEYMKSKQCSEFINTLTEVSEC